VYNNVDKIFEEKFYLWLESLT